MRSCTCATLESPAHNHHRKRRQELRRRSDGKRQGNASRRHCLHFFVTSYAVLHKPATQERQMCARKELVLRIPEEVKELFDEACRAVMKAENRMWMKTAQALVVMCRHFIDTYAEELRTPNTPRDRSMERAGGLGGQASSGPPARSPVTTRRTAPPPASPTTAASTSTTSASRARRPTAWSGSWGNGSSRPSEPPHRTQ
jgi:hypothetical protein